MHEQRWRVAGVGVGDGPVRRVDDDTDDGGDWLQGWSWRTGRARDHLGGTVTVDEQRTTHVAQRSDRRGGFETVTDAITDDEAAPSFTRSERRSSRRRR